MMVDFVRRVAQMPDAQDDQLAQAVGKRNLVAHRVVEIDHGFRHARRPHQHLPHIAAVRAGALADFLREAWRKIVERRIGVAGHGHSPVSDATCAVTIDSRMSDDRLRTEIHHPPDDADPRRDAIPADGARRGRPRRSRRGRFPLAIKPGTIVSGFMPLKTEINPLPLMRKLADAGAQLALPAIAGRGKPLIMRAFAFGDALGVRPMGHPRAESRRTAKSRPTSCWCRCSPSTATAIASAMAPATTT